MLQRFIEQTIVSASYSNTKSDEAKNRVFILSLGDIAPFTCMYKKSSKDRKKGSSPCRNPNIFIC